MIKITSQKELEVLFWSRVDKRGEDECWPWLGGHNGDGYGCMKWLGKQRRCNRISWTLSYGEIPNGLLVCHKCDNPNCVNPKHLFLGNFQANSDDKLSKGRQANGKKAAHPPKLTEEQVLEIRRLCECGHGHSELSMKYGVHRATIYMIHIRKNWAWLK